VENNRIRKLSTLDRGDVFLFCGVKVNNRDNKMQMQMQATIAPKEKEKKECSLHRLLLERALDKKEQ